MPSIFNQLSASISIIVISGALAGLGLGGCSSAKKRTHTAPLLPGMSSPAKTAEKPTENPTKNSAEDSTPEKAPASDAIESDILSFDDEANAKGDSIENSTNNEDESDAEVEAPTPARKKHGVPFEFNKKVASWIEYFAQHDRERFQRFLDRGEPYREAVENILEENNVPVDLYYLGFIESGFNFRAKSSAKAVGVWQFMKSTGKLYGLGVDNYVDERKDPIRATEAAARHLRDLYHEFKSWYLAMAAYNAGTGRIRSAVRRGRSNDFWELVEKKVLPRETMEYVPKFMAARYIAENPDVFAFYINEEQKYPDVQLVKVPSPITFESIERTCKIPSGTLEFVNPQYLTRYTHPGRKVDEIWVPTAYQKSVEANFNALAAARVKLKPVRVVVKGHAERVPVYVVRNGDSLRSIARKRGLSVAYLKDVNGLRSGQITVGQRLKLSATSYSQKRTHPRTRKRRKVR